MWHNNITMTNFPLSGCGYGYVFSFWEISAVLNFGTFFISQELLKLELSNFVEGDYIKSCQMDD